MAKARANIASLETDVQDSPENESVSDRTQLSKNRIDLDARVAHPEIAMPPVAKLRR
jgi:hypothetical protein